MNSIFTGNGFLSKEGEQFVSDFRYGISQIMESDEVRDMSEQELRVLLSNMQRMVGDAIFERISRAMQLTNELNALTDEQFYAQLQEKYGDNWLLQGLEKEELARLPHGDLQRLANEHKDICVSIRQHMLKHGVKFK